MATLTAIADATSAGPSDGIAAGRIRDTGCTDQAISDGKRGAVKRPPRSL